MFHTRVKYTFPCESSLKEKRSFKSTSGIVRPSSRDGRVFFSLSCLASDSQTSLSHAERSCNWRFLALSRTVVLKWNAASRGCEREDFGGSRILKKPQFLNRWKSTSSQPGWSSPSSSSRGQLLVAFVHPGAGFNEEGTYKKRLRPTGASIQAREKVNLPERESDIHGRRLVTSKWLALIGLSRWLCVGRRFFFSPPFFSLQPPLVSCLPDIWKHVTHASGTPTLTKDTPLIWEGARERAPSG